MKKKIVAAACAILMSTGSHAGLCPPFNEMAVIGKLGLVEGVRSESGLDYVVQGIVWKPCYDDKRELSAMRGHLSSRYGR